MSKIYGIPGEIPVDGNIYKGIETESTTTHVDNFTKEISVNVKDDYFNEKLETKQDKLIAGEGIEINENNEISVMSAEDTLEITSEDITVEDDKIVFNSDVAQEIMSMNKRIRVDASITDPTLEQGKFIAVFTPRGIKDYSSLQEGTTVYEYSTTNWLLDTYRTTYVEFVWNETTEKLYVNKNTPAHYEDHIVGFSTSFNDGNIRLTENVDMQISSLNALHINGYNVISINTPSPSLEFNANSNNELESVVFREDGSSVDFNYTIPKVVANPTLAGTEADLTGLEVDGTKYKVSSGGGGSDVHLYQHNIHLKSNFTTNREFVCSVISKIDTPFNVSTFMDFLLSNGFNHNSRIYPVSATNIFGIFYDNGGITGVSPTDQPGFGLPKDYILTDVVIEILQEV